MKKCTTCKLDKEATTEFFTCKKAKPDGLNSICKDCESKSYKKYYDNNAEAQKKKTRDYYLLNKERLNKLSCASHQKRRAKARIKVIEHYSNGTMTCARCGWSDIRALTVDHIDGLGAAHRREINNAHLSDWLIRNGLPDGYQILCMNHQFVKRFENNEVKGQLADYFIFDESQKIDLIK